MKTNDLKPTVAAFYQGQASHPVYGTLVNIHAKLLSIEDNLFFKPDFLNWLFPWINQIDNLDAPITTYQDLEAFRRYYELRRKFNRSIQIILHFYGMELRAEAVHASENFATVASLWLTNPDSSNLLRITHLLRSMTLFGEKHLAASMLAILERIQQAFPQRISPQLLETWRQAIAEGEKQFYYLFDSPQYSYQQFWQQTIVEKTLAIKELLFNHVENAQILIDLMRNKGFHSTRINSEIETLKIYPDNSKSRIYLTQGQYDLFSTLNFQLSRDKKLHSGKEIINHLLES